MSQKAQEIFKKSRREMNNSTSTCITSIPLEIILKILSGLPPKSVVRFRCSSKFFYSFIPEPHLAFRILVSLPSTTRPLLNLYTMSYNEESQGELQANSVQYLDVQRFQGWVDSSFADGKICLFSCFGEAALCDLSTKQHISLPRTFVRSNCPTYPTCSVSCSDMILRRRNNNCETVRTCAVLGFDSVSKRYKVFKSELYYDYDFERTSTRQWVRRLGQKFSRQWVLTLGVDESWRETNSFIHGQPRAGVHIDGVIYLILPNIKSNIVTFDVRTESFSMIHSPYDQFHPNYPPLLYSPWVNLNGRLAFINIYIKDLWRKIDIWTLEKSMEWKKHMVPLPLEESQIISNAHSMDFSTNSMGEIVFLIQGRRKSPLILLYAFGRQVWRKFKIRGLHDYSPTFDGCRSVVHLIEESVSFAE